MPRRAQPEKTAKLARLRAAPPGSSIPETDFLPCLSRIREILGTARRQALQAVDATMLPAYWHTGREIVEEEQRGQQRAEYGARLLQTLSARLTAEFGRGYSLANLKLIRQFYQCYADRRPEVRSSSPLSAMPAMETTRRAKIGYSASSQLATPRRSDSAGPAIGFRSELSFTHYRVLMRVAKAEARSFYEIECAKSRWSVTELERQISTLLYERLARSRDKAGLLALAERGHEVHRPEDLVKDPYVLEFLGLPEAERWHEKDLENALIDRLQRFLLELGRDLFFVARQRRITIDGDHYYVDLVFYHRTLRAFLLIDLKVGKLTQQDLGQMLMYMGYFEAEVRRPDENPPIGLVLCTYKSDTAVKYTLSQDTKKLFASRYQLYLPTEEELRQELQRESIAIKTDSAEDAP